jgi:hypothetical protein
MCLHLTLGHGSTATGTIDLTEVALLHVVFQLTALNTHAACVVRALDKCIRDERGAENTVTLSCTAHSSNRSINSAQPGSGAR